MLRAGVPQDTDSATRGAAAALGHLGLSQPTRAQQCPRQGGQEARLCEALVWKSPIHEDAARPRATAEALDHKPSAARSRHSG